MFCCLFSDHSTIFSRHTQIEPRLINARENTAIENTLEKVKNYARKFTILHILMFYYREKVSFGFEFGFLFLYQSNELLQGLSCLLFHYVGATVKVCFILCSKCH